MRLTARPLTTLPLTTLPLAFVLAGCAPLLAGPAEPPPVAVLDPAEARALDAASILLRLPCRAAAEAEAGLAASGYRLAAAGVASGAVIRLWLGEPDGFALVAHLPDGRACLIAEGAGWTGIRQGAGLQALIPFEAVAPDAVAVLP